jgi:hypothetical protein
VIVIWILNVSFEASEEDTIAYIFNSTVIFDVMGVCSPEMIAKAT